MLFKAEAALVVTAQAAPAALAVQAEAVAQPLEASRVLMAGLDCQRISQCGRK